MKNRPAIVTLIGVLGAIGSAVNLVGGLVIIYTSNRTDLIEGTSFNHNELLWTGIAAVGVSLFGLYLAYSILNGQKWTRVWYGIIGTVQVVAGVWALLFTRGETQWVGLISAIIWFIVLNQLFNEKADNFFEG